MHTKRSSPGSFQLFCYTLIILIRSIVRSWVIHHVSPTIALQKSSSASCTMITVVMAVVELTDFGSTSDCFTRSADHWVWSSYANSKTSSIHILGSPDQRTSCYPEEYSPASDLIYRVNACPDAFTSAGTSTIVAGNVLTLTICCPT